MFKRKHTFESYSDDGMVIKRQKDLVYMDNVPNTEAKIPLAKRKNETMLDMLDMLDMPDTGFFPKKCKQFENPISREYVINVEYLDPVYLDPVYYRKININPHVRTIDLARKVGEGWSEPPHKIRLYYRGRLLLNNELLFDELFDANSVVYAELDYVDF